MRTFAGDGMRLRQAIISVLLFGVIAEWFIPLVQLSDLTEIYRVAPFLAAFAGFLFIDWVTESGWFRWPAKFAVCLSAIGYLFFPDFFPGLTWIGEFASVLYDDAKRLWRQQFDAVSREMRTFIFLTGWMLLISVSQALILQRRKAWWLSVGTAVYLAVLQLTTGLDVSRGIVSGCALCLVMQALLQFDFLESRFGVRRASRLWPMRWLLVAVIAAGGAVASGLYTAQGAAETKTPDWSEFESWFARLESSPLYMSVLEPVFSPEDRPSATGYGLSDSRLGGAVREDDSVAFAALTEQMTYWRGESKSYYDGQGWTQIDNTGIRRAWDGGGPLSFAELPNPGRPPVRQHVFLRYDLPQGVLFSGGTIRRIDTLANAGERLRDGVIVYYSGSGKFKLEQPPNLDRYELLADPGLFVREASDALHDTNPQPVPSGPFADYLQLPAGLPERVTQLAEQIVAGESSDLARARAIETYLRQHYAYSLEQAEYPSPGEDFVDHFLFTQMLGYCDHFSTSMAVMLRAVGIPARWVKGFAPGEKTSWTSPELGDDARTYRAQYEQAGIAMIPVIVRNSHAHSWVEAYISGLGWVSFEPTPGFAGFAGLTEDAGGSGVPTGGAETLPALDEIVQEEPEREGALRRSSVSGGAPLPGSETSALFRIPGIDLTVRELFALVCLILAILIAITIRLSVVHRPRLMLWWLLRRYPASGADRERTLRIFDLMWQLIFRKQGSKAEHDTIREYVSTLAAAQSNADAWKQFVCWYECFRYELRSGAPGRLCKKQLVACWRAIRE